MAMQSERAVSCGLLWFGYSGFNWMLGYGLKRPKGFESTHLGDL
ncbi:hypothetical protein PSJ8397_00649 [Pseudooctadecabacter jejudonensis]|uniref:Uncharacterized protein n=1 Tax=Pseudooctadecabacter jejudonensis TaxID=1391910 RepID=A0A1Y5RJP5_9RHOB|nr:hypothetical protein PSJ8397_00649 [Pseudooctadecabacter jejudonensis]